MTDAYLARMLAVACEMAGAQGATLFVVDGPILCTFRRALRKPFFP